MADARYLALGPLLSGEGSRAFLGLRLVEGQAPLPVALIWVPEELSSDAELLDGLQRESLHAATLEHPNILRVHGLARLEEGLARVVEFADGEPLRRLLELTGPLPPRLAARLMADAALGVNFAHVAGNDDGSPLVHGDLRPETLLVCFNGGLKVTGYGALGVAPRGPDGAHARRRSLYCAPEQVLGGRKAIQQQTDVYLLGLCLAECLSGKAPFADATDLDQALLTQPLEVPPGPPALQEIVRRATAKKASERYETPRALREALEKAMAPLPTPEEVAAYLVAKLPPDQLALRGARQRELQAGIDELQRRPITSEQPVAPSPAPGAAPAPHAASAQAPGPAAAAAPRAAPAQAPAPAAAAVASTPHTASAQAPAPAAAAVASTPHTASPQAPAPAAAAVASTPHTASAQAPAPAAAAAAVVAAAPHTASAQAPAPAAAAAAVVAAAPHTASAQAPAPAAAAAPHVASAQAPAPAAAAAPRAGSAPTASASEPTAAPARPAAPARRPPSRALAAPEEESGAHHRPVPTSSRVWLIAAALAVVALGWVMFRPRPKRSPPPPPEAIAAPASAPAAALPAPQPTSAAAPGSPAPAVPAPAATPGSTAPAVAAAPGSTAPAAAAAPGSTAPAAAAAPGSTAPAAAAAPGTTASAAAATIGSAAAAAPSPPPAPAVAAAPPKPVEPPRLELEVDPPVELTIDGVSVGRAPFRGPMAAGRHQVKLEDAARGISVTRSIHVKPSGTTAARLEIGRGRVAVSAPDGAVIYIDDRKVGVAPIDEVPVYEGQHRIRVTVGKAKWQQSFSVRPGERMYFNVETQ